MARAELTSVAPEAGQLVYVRDRRSVVADVLHNSQAPDVRAGSGVARPPMLEAPPSPEMTPPGMAKTIE
jgi:hypothetical protein